MSGPLTNFELGKIRHREYEARTSPHAGQNRAGNEEPNLLKKQLAGYTKQVMQILQRAVTQKSAQPFFSSSRPGTR